MERRTVVQPARKAESDEVGNLSLEAGFVWLETNATVPETDAICERLSAMKIGFSVRQMHIDKAFHGVCTSNATTFSSSTAQTISGESPASRSRTG